MDKRILGLLLRKEVIEEMLNEKVKNIKYGVGTIVGTDDNKITVKFEEVIEEKIFKYPDAFEGFLNFENNILEEKVLEDLRAKNERLAIEKREKMIRNAKEDEERKKEKLEMAKLKRQAMKKTKKI